MTIHEHPREAADGAAKPPVPGFVCPGCGRTDEVVRTRRTLEAADLGRVWAFDGLSRGRPDTRLLKCRACGRLFKRPPGPARRTLAWAAAGVLLPAGLAALGWTLRREGVSLPPVLRSLTREAGRELASLAVAEPEAALGLAAGATAWSLGTAAWLASRAARARREAWTQRDGRLRAERDAAAARERAEAGDPWVTPGAEPWRGEPPGS